MSGSKRVAVVTGANRGIGFEVCRQLERAGIEVVLTARDRDKGLEAVDRLARDGHEVHFHPLDIASVESAAALADHLRETFGRLDVLVNNAGVFLDPRDTPSVFQARFDTIRESFEVNTLGTLQVTRALLPLLEENDYGRIVMVSSAMGQLEEMGGGYPGYRLSKVALNALTRILAAELAGSNILVNTMHPGWVQTDMGGPGANRSVEEGADTITYLATLPDGGPTGGFFRDREPYPW